MWQTKAVQNKKAKPKRLYGGISRVAAIAATTLRYTFFVAGLCLIASSQAISNKVEAATLKRWKFDPQINQLEIIIEEGTTPNYFLLQDPLRLVIDLPNTQLGTVPTTANYPGVVYRVRVSQHSEDVTRIVLDFFPEETFQVEKIELKQSNSELDSTQWVLRPLINSTSGNNPIFSSILPPANFPRTGQPTVVVPPLNNNPQRATTSTTGENPSSPERGSPTIEFGQPLPKKLSAK